MASTRATNALKSYIAQSVARNETVTFDKIIFAHISGLNDATLANINNMPTVDQIKHTANIQQTGYIADDQVVYSVTLGSEIGDFTFNFVGLINSAKNVLGVAIYTGDIVKTRTKAEEQGNALTRNIILQVNNAKTLTNIQTQAKAWQFDFTDKFLQIKPKKITATTTNTADSSGHTHEIDKASTTQSGIVQLVDDWTTHDNSKALTASTGKRLYDTLKGLIDSLSGRATTAQNTAANALSKTTPKKITATTTNATDQNGHTHEIDKASTSVAGVVKLNDSLTSTAANEALTARQGRVLDEKISQTSNNLDTQYVGMVGYFARQSPPAGWLKANGATVSRKTYAALFAAIGTTFGAGDGHSTFNLPDLRGEFVRGLDEGRNVDNGRQLGSSQGDAIRNIVGKLDGSNLGAGHQVLEGEMIATGAIGAEYQQRRWSGDAGDWGNQAVSFDFDASRVVPTANENRPRNIALLACIKY